MFWRAVYNTIVIPALYLGFHVAARLNPKVRAGIAGRHGVFEKLENQLQSARRLPKTAWFHFTSVGEFEQARPLIESIKDEVRIVLTHFSPSVEPHVAKYPHCDAAVYLPFDTRRNAEQLITHIKPSILVFSNSDIWPNLVWAASDHKLPVVLIAGTIHAKSKRLSRVARPFYKSVNRHITLHCVISDADAQRFCQICPSDAQIAVMGDTRFDRVYQRAMMVDGDNNLFPGQSTVRRPIWIAGSTYTEDEAVLLEAYHLLRNRVPQLTLILVPHEPTKQRISEIQTQIDRFGFAHACFSELDDRTTFDKTDIIVIDTIGILAQLYRLGDIAFVGGSFHGRVHNVMEPAVMARPIIFGPTIHNAHEANVLKERGAARLVNTAQEMAGVLEAWLSNTEERRQVGQLGQQVVEENLGATERTLVHLRDYLSE